jgi:energy-coupling factor transporter ATP-binding protein EcfA2
MSKDYITGDTLEVKGINNYSMEQMIDVSLFYKKSLLVTGGTGSGKTTIIKYIMDIIIKSLTSQIYVLTPESSQGNYTGINPLFIKSTLNGAFINSLLKSQEKKALLRLKITKRDKWILFLLCYLCFDPDEYNKMVDLYAKNTTEETIDKIVKMINKKKNEIENILKEIYSNLLDPSYDITEYINQLSFMKYYDDDLMKMCELNIFDEMSELYDNEKSCNNTKKIGFILKYINNAFINLTSNIDAVLIVEDLTAELETLAKLTYTYTDPDTGNLATASTLSSLLNRSRHFNLTNIIVSHGAAGVKDRSLYHAILSTDIQNTKWLLKNGITVVPEKDINDVATTIDGLKLKNGEKAHAKFFFVKEDLNPEKGICKNIKYVVANKEKLDKEGVKPIITDSAKNIIIDASRKRKKNLANDL